MTWVSGLLCLRRPTDSKSPASSLHHASRHGFQKRECEIDNSAKLTWFYHAGPSRVP
jgi:hypothetical protein